MTAQLHDCKVSIRWLRANATALKVDATRIGVIGVSAGAHLAALLGTTSRVAELEGQDLGHSEHSSAVQAVVDCFGPIDFLIDEAEAKEASSPESLLLGTTCFACILLLLYCESLSCSVVRRANSRATEFIAAGKSYYSHNV